MTISFQNGEHFDMPDHSQRFRVTDEQRHRDALAYLQATSRDAVPDDDAGIHIHLHGAPGGLPASTGNSLPPPGRASGSPTKDEPRPSPSPDFNENYRLRSGRDQEAEEEEGEENEQVLGVLPEPEAGYRYEIRENADRSCAVVLVPDDGAEELAAVNTGDNLRSASDSKTRSVLAAMNKANKAYHVRDAVSAATKENVIFIHTPARSERLVLRQNGNHWELILISSTTDLTGEIPPGAQQLDDSPNEDDGNTATGWSTAPGGKEKRLPGMRVGDRKPNLLAMMNQQHRAFWARK